LGHSRALESPSWRALVERRFVALPRPGQREQKHPPELATTLEIYQTPLRRYLQTRS
jgi:hypothetical protein